jgi:hypothetical protein
MGKKFCEILSQWKKAGLGGMPVIPEISDRKLKNERIVIQGYPG